eukprot:51956-Eustigmatos_ZCMA.PRE.1
MQGCFRKEVRAAQGPYPARLGRGPSMLKALQSRQLVSGHAVSTSLLRHGNVQDGFAACCA